MAIFDARFRPSPWSTAHASPTFYGDGSASTTMGGACGYENLFDTRYGTSTAALSSVLFEDGYSCGTCYQIRCFQASACLRRSPIVTVTTTNLCPPNWNEPSDNGRWCKPPHVHFDMSKPAFFSIAYWHAGIVPVMYRRVPCRVQGRAWFLVQGNNGYWLLAIVMNVGGAGYVGGMGCHEGKINGLVGAGLGFNLE